MSSPSDLICNFERNPYSLAYPILTRKMECRGETLNHGRLLYHDRSHAEDGLQDVRGTSVLQRPKRSGDRKTSGGVCSAPTEAKRRPWTHGRLPRNNRSHAEDGASEVRGTLIVQCGRWDLNPHDCNNHKILSLARLPVPTLPHIFDFLSLVSRDFDIISNQTKYVNT